MFSRIHNGPIQETGPLAVCEGSARLKMMPFWFGFGRQLFFKRRALWPCAKDQPAWRRRLLFRFILRLSGRQSKRWRIMTRWYPKSKIKKAKYGMLKIWNHVFDFVPLPPSNRSYKVTIHNNVMCSSTIIEYKNKSVAKRLVCCSQFELVDSRRCCW